MTVSERLRSIMLRSITASSLWRSSVISVEQASGTKSTTLRVEKIRACSDYLSDALSGRPHQSLQPSFTALSFRAIFMSCLGQFVFYLSCEITFVFLWATIGPNFTEHFTFRFCIRNWKTSGKSVKFDMPNYFGLQNMNSDGLTFLTKPSDKIRSPKKR